MGLGAFTLNNDFIANGTVLSGLTIGGVNDYGTITMNQVLGCAIPTACGATGVSLGNGTTIPTFPVTIQAGGMVASGTNTVASPAALSANNTYGGNVQVGGAITTANSAINILAGNAVPGANARGSILQNSNLTSNGGAITIANGSAGASTAYREQGVTVLNATVDARGTTTGGDITVTGTGVLNTPFEARGVDITTSTLKTNGDGMLTVTGTSGIGTTGGVTNDAGVLFNGGSTLSTGAGKLTVTGTVQSQGDDSKVGIWFYDNTTNIYTTSGDIQLTGFTGSGGNQAIYAGGTANVGWSGGLSTPTTGSITLQGQDAGNNGGMYLNNMFVKTNGGALTIGSTPLGIDGISPGKGVGNFTLNNGFIANGTILSGLNLGDLNTYGTLTVNQPLGCASPPCAGVTLGGINNIPTFPVLIQAGGMYNGTPATSGGTIYGGNVSLGASIYVPGQPLSVLAGGAVLGSTATGGIEANGAYTFDTNGGDITFANGSSGGNASFAGGIGVYLHNGGTVDATNGSNGGGSITMVGTGAASGSPTWSVGVAVQDTETVKTNGSGAITLTGTGKVLSSESAGVWLTNTAALSTTAGAITINGTGVGGFGGIYGNNTLSISTTSGPISLLGIGQRLNGTNSPGIFLNAGTRQIYSASGPISLMGYATGVGNTEDAIVTNGTNYVGWSGPAGTNGVTPSVVTTNNITIQGQDGGLDGGIALNSISLKTIGGALTIGSTPFDVDGVSPGKGVGTSALPSGGIANGTVLSGFTFGDVNAYGTWAMNQALGCASPPCASGVTLGAFPVLIQAGGMYNGAPANSGGVTPTLYGGNVSVGGAITTMANQPITILAGQAVPNPAGQTTTYSTAPGSINILTSLRSNGGDITLSNVNPITGIGSTNTGINTGRGVFIGYNGSMQTIDATNTSTNTGGNINITGYANGWVGAEIDDVTISTLGSNGTGTILVRGTVVGGGASTAGINIGNRIGGTTALVTTGGDITLIGKTNATSGPGDAGGVSTWNGTNAIYSTSGDIVLQGFAQSNSVAAINNSAGNLYIGWNGTGSGTTGNVVLQGQDFGNNAGMNLANVRVKINAASANPTGGMLTVGSTPFDVDGVSPGKGVGSFTLASNFIAPGSVLSNLAIGDLHTYGTVTINESLGCANPPCATGVTLGGINGFSTFPLVFQAGGMYGNAPANNGAASPTYYGGNVRFNSLSMITNNPTVTNNATAAANGSCAICVLAGSAVPGSTASGDADIRSTNLISGGGNITISNGGQSGAGGSNYSSVAIAAISSTIDAGLNTNVGGNIAIVGMGPNSPGNSVSERGIDINGSTVKTTGPGTLSLLGDSGANGGSSYAGGVLFQNGATLQTEQGALDVMATVRATGGSGTAGLYFYNGTTVINSTSGPITLTGIADVSATAVWTGGTAYVGWDGNSTHPFTSGNITVQGQDAGANGGMYLNNMFVKTNGGSLNVGSYGKGVGAFTLNNGFVASGTVLSNLIIGDLNTYSTLQMNQIFGLGCASLLCSNSVALGGVNGIPTFPVTIEVGGMYNGAPAASGNTIYGGNIRLGALNTNNAAIITANQAISILVGSAVSGSTATGAIFADDFLTASGGGNITLSNMPLNSTNLGAGASSAFGSQGIQIRASNFDATTLTGGGNILINGRGVSQVNNGTAEGIGVFIYDSPAGNFGLGSVFKTSGAGTLTVRGDSGTLGNADAAAGIYMDGPIKMSTGQGALKLLGTLNVLGARANAGIWVNGNTAKIYSTGTRGNGDITLAGYTSISNTKALAVNGGAVVDVGWDGASIVTGANLFLQGEDTGNSTGSMPLAGFSLKTNGGALTIG